MLQLSNLGYSNDTSSSSPNRRRNQHHSYWYGTVSYGYGASLHVDECSSSSWEPSSRSLRRQNGKAHGYCYWRHFYQYCHGDCTGDLCLWVNGWRLCAFRSVWSELAFVSSNTGHLVIGRNSVGNISCESIHKLIASLVCWLFSYLDSNSREFDLGCCNIWCSKRFATITSNCAPTHRWRRGFLVWCCRCGVNCWYAGGCRHCNASGWRSVYGSNSLVWFTNFSFE